MARTKRLLDLLDLLRTRRRPVTAEQLGAMLGVSSRSVYRDIGTLRAMDAPIDGEAGVGYRLRPGFFLPPMMLTADEVDALSLGASWVRQRGDPALATAADSALAKIAAMLPARAGAGGFVPSLVTAAPRTAPADPGSVSLLRDAVRRQRKLAVRYRDVEGRESDRILWPIAIAYFDDVRVLAAWCEDRAAFRHFRVDRLMAVTPLDERYPGRRGHLVRQWREGDRATWPRS